MRIDNKVWAAVFLVSILFTVLHGRIKGKDSEHWTPVTGVITHSSVNYAWRQDSPTHGRMEYVLDIRYRSQQNCGYAQQEKSHGVCPRYPLSLSSRGKKLRG